MPWNSRSPGALSGNRVSHAFPILEGKVEASASQGALHHIMAEPPPTKSPGPTAPRLLATQQQNLPLNKVHIFVLGVVSSLTLYSIDSSLCTCHAYSHIWAFIFAVSIACKLAPLPHFTRHFSVPFWLPQNHSSWKKLLSSQLSSCGLHLYPQLLRILALRADSCIPS